MMHYLSTSTDRSIWSSASLGVGALWWWSCRRCPEFTCRFCGLFHWLTCTDIWRWSQHRNEAEKM